MRERAKQAGNMNATAQEKVSSKGKTIVIEPIAIDVVYVPQYDPRLDTDQNAPKYLLASAELGI
jgi:hypothetical protein